MTVRARYRVDAALGEYDAHVDDGLLLYRWKLNELAGTTFRNTITPGFPDGTLSGTPTYGVLGPYATDRAGLGFTGTQYLTMGDVAALEFAPAANSVGWWFRTTHTATEQTVCGKMSAAGAGWRITLLANGKIRYLVQTAALGTIILLDSVNAYNDGEWHRAFTTWTGGTGANGAKLYVDGALVNQTTAAAGTPAANAEPFLIGAYSASFLLKFNGDLADVDIYTDVRTAVEILADWTSAQWVDLSDDVHVETGIRFSRGIVGRSPVDLVATPGAMTLALRNDAENAGQTLGWYSPFHANVRSGWGEDVAIRLLAEYAPPLSIVTEYPLWRGRVKTIRVRPGRDLERLVDVYAEGCLGAFARRPLRNLEIQVDQTEEVLIRTVAAAVPYPQQPPGLNIDTGVMQVPYAFDQNGDGKNGLSLLQQIAVTVVGRIYEAADGSLTYSSRQHSDLGDVAHTVTDLELAGDPANFAVPVSSEQVIDRVRLTLHPKTVGASATDVIYSSPSVIVVPSGSSISFSVNYADPDNTLKLIGATDYQDPPVASTDYAANSQADGLGSDLTGDQTVTVDFLASRAQVTLANAAIGDAYYVNGSGEPFFQLRGRRISDDGERSTGEPLVPDDYDEDHHLYVFDQPFQDDILIADQIVQLIITSWGLPQSVERIPLDPQTDSTELQAALGVEITDTWEVSEELTGTEDEAVMVLGIEGEIVEQDILNMTLRTGVHVEAVVF